ncbi:MAG TPA: hypothetical protein VEW47_11730 [Candidatus Dormibacteraeota bacterium]|nr:hypothetical protein [Candidatus Dormibacteraeota bacterium]
MTSTILEIFAGRAGLVLDLIGAVYLWRGATPPGWRPSYALIAPNDWDPDKDRAEYESLARTWEQRNRIGLGFLVVGFLFQLLGTFAGR